MSKDMCQRCRVKEATVTSEAGHFCSDCDELNDVEQENASAAEENKQLRQLLEKEWKLPDAVIEQLTSVIVKAIKQAKEEMENERPYIKSSDL